METQSRVPGGRTPARFRRSLKGQTLRQSSNDRNKTPSRDVWNVWPSGMPGRIPCPRKTVGQGGLIDWYYREGRPHRSGQSVLVLWRCIIRQGQRCNAAIVPSRDAIRAKTHEMMCIELGTNQFLVRDSLQSWAQATQYANEVNRHLP